MTNDLTRRSFLGASAGLVAGGAGLVAGGAGLVAGGATLPPPLEALVRAPDAPPRGGAAGATGAPAPTERRWLLDVQWMETLLGGTRVRLRTYGGAVPGPLLEARPGDTLRITVRNHLTAYDSSAWAGDMNVPHHLNTTNLHLHGLEVVPHLFEPVGTQAVGATMIAIGPGEEREYVFELPEDQPPGLFWYHPHHHGSTAVQAVTGMAGALVVRGAIDEVPEIAAAREVVLVLQDIGLFPGASADDPWTYDPPQNAIWDTFSGKVRMGADPTPTELTSGFTTGDYARRYYLVNGTPYFREDHNPSKPQEPAGTQLPVPRWSFRPGEVVRFRMLNGNSDNLMPLVVEGHDVHLIALDGVNFPAPRTLPAPEKVLGSGPPQLLLAPANRAEFLIRASATPGTYRIVQRAQSQQFLYSDQKTVAEFVVEGEPAVMDLPTELPLPTRHYPLIRDDEIERRREVTFSAHFPGTVNPIVGMDFMINGALYDERSVADDWIVALDAVEEWVLRVPDEAHGGNEGHPFHIHVNSFEVHSIGGVRRPPGTIQDTIWVHQDDEVVIRMKFRQWRGKSVFHCHILPHEDTGMMNNFLIR